MEGELMESCDLACCGVGGQVTEVLTSDYTDRPDI